MTHTVSHNAVTSHRKFWAGLLGPKGRTALLLVLLYLAAGCGFAGSHQLSGKSYVIKGVRYHILASAEGFEEKGLASWYGEPFHGRKTASGEVYNMHEFSAAHKVLPLQTWVEVKNLENNRSLYVKINDRGPFVKGRVIDLSMAAAKELGVFRPGVARVLLRAVTGDKARALSSAGKKSRDRAGDSDYSAFGVEVASTTDPDRAQRLVSDLEREYSPVRLGVVHSGQATRFYVYVDGLGSQKEAQSLQTRLARRGYAEARVVNR